MVSYLPVETNPTLFHSLFLPEKLLVFDLFKNLSGCLVNGNSFNLNDLLGMNVSTKIAERGHEYYMANNVRYISLDGTKGYAIIEGSSIYEVEFEYNCGEISRLVCSCFCSNNCKHEFAAMLQLRETLELISKNYADKYEHTGYFAAINKGTLFAFAIDGKDNGTFTL